MTTNVVDNLNRNLLKRMVEKSFNSVIVIIFQTNILLMDIRRIVCSYLFLWRIEIHTKPFLAASNDYLMLKH